MIKKGIVFIVLGVLLIGCKAKKRTTYARTAPKKQVVSKPVKKQPYEDNGYYTLPEDTGQFVQFPINSVAEYIDTFSEIAQMEMKAYGIPASITLAQGLLESGFGRGELALKSNNHFGIKCHRGWEGDRTYHDDDEAGECFRKYNHPMYSFRDHSIFLSGRSRYAGLFELDSDDYKRWAKGLKQAGYATDKRYPQKLISLIEQHRLYQYDRGVVQQGYGQETTSVQRNPTTYVVKKGDTLYSISRRYSVSVEDLRRINQIPDNTISVGQELTVQPSRVNK
ncbi:LysM peptidoglycan-binding domain-containing protein [Flavobacteriaceae bacterium TP-CH-4]|uniref:Peptidoglycan hydrolase n=1 Tax=Pelagihabitans pacificus TaxID=2696054 RepID=A0A967E7B8_9FLAO|nr:glucosaminidase domain-containing protein [Pelagihabitans pacificus]NHF61427.1 LysM peptidoglycan-binding domain-containing protein [Pelagihabitans pacificus]